MAVEHEQRTELQILVQAMAAIQLEIKALALGLVSRSSDFEPNEIHKYRAQAKTLMQSAEADADTLAMRGRVFDKSPPSGEGRPGQYDPPVINAKDDPHGGCTPRHPSSHS